MTQIDVLDQGYVEPIEFWGSDERVIESARMSTGGGFVSWEPYEKHPKGDMGLLSYMWKHGHHTPFEQCGLTVEVKAPIIVARQWFRHRTLCFNEFSARYSALPDDFYVPSQERLAYGGQSKSNKQASGEPLRAELVNQIQHLIRDSSIECFEAYETMLQAGLSKELARLVLPVNFYTTFRVSGNLRNWLHFCKLRNSEDAQWEIREYSNVVTNLLHDKFPRTVELFLGS